MTHDRWVVLAMAVVFAAAGLIEPHLPFGSHPQNAVTVVQTFIMAVLLFAWCKAHARTNAIQAPTGAALLVGVFPLVGVPYYAFRGYPWRRALRLLAWAIATCIGLAALHLLCFHLSATLGT